MLIDPHTMTTADVARALGIGVGRVRQMDDLLLPVRVIGSRHRRYDPQHIAAVAARRAVVVSAAL